MQLNESVFENAASPVSSFYEHSQICGQDFNPVEWTYEIIDDNEHSEASSFLSSFSKITSEMKNN